MNTDRQTFSGLLWVQWLLIIALLSAVVVGNYIYSEFSLFYRVLVALGVLLVTGGIFYTTEQGKNLYRLALQARLELSRVVWPTRPEIVQTFIAVMVVVGIVMLILWIMDSFFSWLAFVLLG
ncbi:MAG: preprotein translocase subunit SecE [Candidatus Portiera sp.]|nr:preprotein translocase subunit SecE [Portiera sp.]